MLAASRRLAGDFFYRLYLTTALQRGDSMKTAKEYSNTIKRDVDIDVDALLAAINEISESEVHRVEDEEGQRVSVDGREYHTWRELAEAFELDVHDFSITEANR
jgi:hypothetical protein